MQKESSLFFAFPSNEFCRAQNEVPNNKICYMEVQRNFGGAKAAKKREKCKGKPSFLCFILPSWGAFHILPNATPEKNWQWPMRWGVMDVPWDKRTLERGCPFICSEVLVSAMF